HDAENWPLLREALKAMGRADLIGNGKKHLVPAWQPAGVGQTARPTANAPVRGDARPGRVAAPARREVKQPAPSGRPAKRRPK
ncbi:MAG: DUF3362 domain-containing protein, partial [Betaproteobacteria bacterium]|nr:DUF3362 domain-containing protein [Betaproteobacteria bacterium]